MEAWKVICRKAILRFPIPIPRLLEHKNSDFVLGKPENGGGQRAKAHKNLDFVLGNPENLTSGLVLVLLLMLIIDNLDVAIFCIDWIYNNNYFILHCQR